MTDWLVPLAAARAAAPEAGRLSALMLRHGSMSLRYYAPPADADPQLPHDQDEIYIVISGSGSMLSGPGESTLERRSFRPGDAILVPAGHVHRFADYTPDLAVWVVFWGPHGGEQV